MGVRKKMFYPVAFATMLCASSAMATITPTAFVSKISEFFLLKDKQGNIIEDMKGYSPTGGAIALWAGIIENLRLYGPYEAVFDKDGKREYIKDKPKTALGHVVKIFFPSVTGQLGTTTGAYSNFARYVANPQTVALILNYTKELEILGKQTSLVNKSTETFEQDILQTLKGIPLEKREAFLNETLKPLLKNIRVSLEDEKRKGSLYPLGTTVQVIESFFCYHFNKQEDIWGLIKYLNGSIVDRTLPIPSKTHYLEAKDVEEIAKKEAPTFEDLFDLTQAYIFTSPTPYKPGISLLSNGTTYFYDRVKDAYLKGSTFQDCVEMSMRHLCNLLLFNPEMREFNLKSIKSFVTEQENKTKFQNPYFKNFEEFYGKQKLLMANAGDIGARSLWNKVVAGLPDINYVRTQEQNEITSGYMNLLKTFDRVFSLSLKPAPKELDKQKTWVEESFQTLFSALNPSYTYTINLHKEKKFGVDLIGIAGITVASQESGRNLFSFNLVVQEGHTTVKDLESHTKQTVDYKKQIKKGRHIFRPGTAEESLLLLASSSLQTDLHPFYQLFPQPLNDNESKLNFLKKLNALYGDLKDQPSFKETLSLITTNVLNNLGWDDPEIVNQILPVIHQFLSHSALEKNMEKSLENSLKNVKAVQISTEVDLERIRFLAQYMTNLERLDFIYLSLNKITGLDNLSSVKELNFRDNLGTLEILSVKGLTKLERLNASNSDINKIEGLEDLPNLKKLNLTKIKKLQRFSLKKVTKLEELILSNSDVKIIEDLDDLVNLKTLDLSGTKKLETLSVKGLTKLEKLYLEDSNIKTIEDLDVLSNLKELVLTSTKKLQTVSLKGLTNLEILILSNSEIKIIEDLDDLVNLKTLNLGDTKNLEKISVKGLTKLEKLFLGNSSIETIEGLEKLSNLKELSLSRTKNLALSVKGLTNLEKLLLKNSNIKTIEDLDVLSNLKELDLWRIRSLETLSVKGLTNLERLDLKYSIIKTIEGIEDLSNLKKLNLEHTPNLQRLSLKKGTKLEELIIRNSGLKAIENLDGLSNLKELVLTSTKELETLSLKGLNNLQNLNLEFSFLRSLTDISKDLRILNLKFAKNITELEFTEDNKHLKLYLNGSGVTRSSIKGIEHLDEDNITW